MFVFDIGRGISGFANSTLTLTKAALVLMPFVFLAALAKSLYITLFSKFFLIPIIAIGLMIAAVWLFKERVTHKKRYIPAAILSSLFMLSSMYFGGQILQDTKMNEDRADKLISALHHSDVASLMPLWPSELQDWHDSIELVSGTAPPRDGYQIGTQYDMNTRRAELKGTWYKVSPVNAIDAYQALAKEHGDWLQFSNDCQRAKNQTGLHAKRNPACKSWESIKSVYGIDLPKRMEVHLAKQNIALADCKKSQYFCARLEKETGLIFK